MCGLSIEQYSEEITLALNVVCIEQLLNNCIWKTYLNFYILPKELALKKLISSGQKLHMQSLVKFGPNKSEFGRSLIIIDDTWIHCYAPEIKMQSKNSSLSQKSDREFFWDNHGATFKDCLEKGKTITEPAHF